MDRRKFLRNISLISASPIIINGIPIRSWASPFEKFLTNADNEKILVFIQLHGGNDGLNTVVPISNYDEYYNLRGNIAIPYTGNRKFIDLDPNLSDAQRIGLHPDMTGAKAMYDEGAMTVVQNVGYENTNMSHFRSRDIWFMGGDYDDYYSSGWMGRFLNSEYPGYPDNYPNTDMEDPLALEMGNAASLALHRDNGIPVGISIYNPDGFYNLVNGVGVNAPANFPNSYYGDELEYLMNFELKTNEYAERLQAVFNAGENSSEIDYPRTYPLNAPPQYVNNPLSDQLQIVARLLSGGSKTRIFLTRISGFDTHASQVESYDTSMGRHAALLYHLSSAVKAFYADLKLQGLDDKVICMTYSEFGRRAYSNASYGSDHGKASPVLLWGPGLKGGVLGNNPDFNDLDNGNLKYTIDYRQVYSSVLKDWFQASDQAMTDTMFGDWINQRLDLFEGVTGIDDYFPTKNVPKLFSCYPNPVRNNVTFSFFIDNTTKYNIRIYSTNGKLVKELQSSQVSRGKYQFTEDLSGLKSGTYIYTLTTNKHRFSKQLIKI